MKRLLTTTAIGLLLAASPALAQTTPDQSSSSPQTEQSKPDMSAPESAPSASPSTPGASSSDQSSPDVSKPADTAQTPDVSKSTDTALSDKASSGSAMLGGETLASNLIGATVENASGDSVGEINDIVFNSDGSAKAVVIGVGGFLGMGEKNVAVEFSELSFKHDKNNNLTVNIAMNAETLQAMPAYKQEGADSGESTKMKDQGKVPSSGSETATPATPGTNR